MSKSGAIELVEAFIDESNIYGKDQYTASAAPCARRHYGDHELKAAFSSIYSELRVEGLMSLR